jgi:hypothetical protein
MTNGGGGLQVGILFSENLDPATGRTQVLVKQVLTHSRLHFPDAPYNINESGDLKYWNGDSFFIDAPFCRRMHVHHSLIKKNAAFFQKWML